jgi:hypothetical protein
MSLHAIADEVTVDIIGDRIDNAPLRRAFQRSGMSAGLVARRIDWLYRRDGRELGDGTRLQRALGMADRRGSGRGPTSRPHRARSIDIDVAARIADAIGADPREVGC